MAGVHQVPGGGEGRAQGGVQGRTNGREGHLQDNLKIRDSSEIERFAKKAQQIKPTLKHESLHKLGKPFAEESLANPEQQFSMDSKSLRSEFDAFDTDGNGVISKDEFMAVSAQSCYVRYSLCRT